MQVMNVTGVYESNWPIF